MSLSPPLFTSAKVDGPNAALLQPSNWNRVTGLLTALLGGSEAAGSLFVKTAGVNGAGWVTPGAAGSLFVSTGPAAPGTWTLTPSLTSLTLSTPLPPASGGTGIAAAGGAGTVLVGGAPYAWTATPTLTDLTLSGVLKLANGSAAAPPIAFSADPSQGFYYGDTNTTYWVNDNFQRVAFRAGTAEALWVSEGIGFGTGNVGSSHDVLLMREAANALALRNGSNAQSARVYKTFTDTGNYERGVVQWVGNNFEVGAEALGTGIQRSLILRGNGVFVEVSGSTHWQFTTVGLSCLTDNLRDIGATNANRPRHAHLAGYVAIGDGITAPGAGTGEARIYVDAADGDLKVVFSDGTIKTIVVDT